MKFYYKAFDLKGRARLGSDWGGFITDLKTARGACNRATRYLKQNKQAQFFELFKVGENTYDQGAHCFIGRFIILTPTPMKSITKPCPKCTKLLTPSTTPGYTWQCEACDEDFYNIELPCHECNTPVSKDILDENHAYTDDGKPYCADHQPENE